MRGECVEPGEDIRLRCRILCGVKGFTHKPLALFTDNALSSRSRGGFRAQGGGQVTSIVAVSFFSIFQLVQLQSQ